MPNTSYSSVRPHLRSHLLPLLGERWVPRSAVLLLMLGTAFSHLPHCHCRPILFIPSTLDAAFGSAVDAGPHTPFPPASQQMHHAAQCPISAAPHIRLCYRKLKITHDEHHSTLHLDSNCYHFVSFALPPSLCIQRGRWGRRQTGAVSAQAFESYRHHDSKE